MQLWRDSSQRLLSTRVTICIDSSHVKKRWDVAMTGLVSRFLLNDSTRIDSQWMKRVSRFYEIWCAPVIFVESESSKIFSSQVRVKSRLGQVRVESQELSSHFQSLVCKLDQMSNQNKFFAKKWRPTCYKMMPDKLRSGAHLIGCPLPNSSIEQWRMVVIVTGHTLSVTSQCDVIFTFASFLTRVYSGTAEQR